MGTYDELTSSGVSFTQHIQNAEDYKLSQSREEQPVNGKQSANSQTLCNQALLENSSNLQPDKQKIDLDKTRRYAPQTNNYSNEAVHVGETKECLTLESENTKTTDTREHTQEAHQMRKPSETSNKYESSDRYEGKFNYVKSNGLTDKKYFYRDSEHIGPDSTLTNLFNKLQKSAAVQKFLHRKGKDEVSYENLCHFIQM